MCASSLNKPSSQEGLENCPFCGKPLYIKRGKINPAARCMTEDCFGTKMPVVSLDVLSDVEAWNTRHPSFNDAIEAAIKCMPTNWCDELLTGPNAPRGPLGNPDVEKLLLAIIERLRSLKLPDYRGGEKIDSTKTAESEHSPSTREG